MKTTFEKSIVGGIEVKNRLIRSAIFEGQAVDNKVSHGDLGGGHTHTISPKSDAG